MLKKTTSGVQGNWRRNTGVLDEGENPGATKPSEEEAVGTNIPLALRESGEDGRGSAPREKRG